METLWDFVLRPATDADTDFARHVHHAAYHDVVVAQFGEWDEEKQDGFFATDWAAGGFQIVERADQACGYLRVEEHPDYLQLHELVLLPEFQGSGIGTSLLAQAQEMSRRQNLPLRLQVLHVNKAVALYRRAGFEPAGETDTHLLMQWDPR